MPRGGAVLGPGDLVMDNTEQVLVPVESREWTNAKGLLTFGWGFIWSPSGKYLEVPLVGGGARGREARWSGWPLGLPLLREECQPGPDRSRVAGAFGSVGWLGPGA